MSPKIRKCAVILALCLLQSYFPALLAEASTSVHIVYLGEKTHDDPALTKKSHYKLLAEFLGSKQGAKKSILYSYRHGFSGFAAKLTDDEARAIAEHPEVITVIPDHIVKPHTTHSWDFLGINHNKPHNLLTENLGTGTIIGVIDSGVWPESKAFSDDGMPEIPSRWKGLCEEGEEFNQSNCNKKLIGARWYLKGYTERFKVNASDIGEYVSARDANQHGTHTAATAAGNFVKNVGVEGLAAGILRGGAPRAHLAIYKVLWGRGGRGTGSDILKAFDQAIYDGVDVISVSIGQSVPNFRYNNVRDPTAVGSFHATQNGITVVASAGNDGPASQTVGNAAPWVITVAATTIDRAFPASISLGNNQTFWGQGRTFREGPFVSAPVAYSSNILAENATIDDCSEGNLNSTLAAGNIVLCFSLSTEPNLNAAAREVARAGGVGLIFAMSHTDNLPKLDFPTIIVDYTIATQIFHYISSAKFPTAKMSRPRTSIGRIPSPRVASFSSRGPSSLTPDILKPDLAAPGVDILSAVLNGGYGFLSGTSMACPHVSGIVALIKSVHRDWTPSVIRSALITTAFQIGTDGSEIYADGPNRKPADPFGIGGGQVNPSKVLDPGLVYNVITQDYVDYLCASGFDDPSLTMLTHKKKSCNRKVASPLDLNLPSISVPELRKGIKIYVTRTVTNIGYINSVYNVTIEAPPGIDITVKPETLIFNAATKSLSYQVTFFSSERLHGFYKFGSIVWNDGKHLVRSPIVVRVVAFESYSDV